MIAYSAFVKRRGGLALILRKQADSSLDIDQKDQTGDSPAEEEEKLYCINCGHLITKGSWRISVGGDHEHTFFNPAGNIYELFCFKEAPGVFAKASPSSEFTWFKGYQWQPVFCSACAVLMGWKFLGEQAPRIFFTLIKSKLANRKPD